MSLKLPSNNTAYDEIIKREVAKYKNLTFEQVKAVIWQESAFNPNAKSGADARGLMQIVPKWHPTLSNYFNPQENIAYGVKFLSSLLTKYKGNFNLALAGYNAGSGNVAKYNGIPPFPETQNYIVKVNERLDFLKKKYNTGGECGKCGAKYTINW